MKLKVGNIYHCKTEWNVHEEETCYRIGNKKRVSYGSIDYYVDEIGDGLIDGEIIEYNKGDLL